MRSERLVFLAEEYEPGGFGPRAKAAQFEEARS
jgi:hypothetical protein